MISNELYLEKMMACWLGKAVGGTLGMPYEGVNHCLNLTFYDPVPTEMLPNDDLDLQVVYAFLLEQMTAPRVDRHLLMQAWKHIGMSPDEYGICKRNIALGLHPPLTGEYDNWFQAGMGAAIRTELWACLAPGDPELAAAYAEEDACMDHAGIGIEAARFLAALESMAFVESDMERLLDGAQRMIATDGELGRAIADTRRWWREHGNGRKVQERIMLHHGHENFTHVTHNLAFIVLGCLASEAAGGDLGTGICTAVNCGQDTDCTGATVGALLGIIRPACVTEQWLAPIGRDLVLSPSITGVKHPPTLDDFNRLVADLRKRINGGHPEPESIHQDTGQLGIRVQLGFLPNAFNAPTAECPRPPAHLREHILPGSSAQLTPETHESGDLYLRYRLDIGAAQPVRILFNSHAANRVYLDGKLLFERGSGPMCPAFHRPPKDQFADMNLTGDDHELVAVLRRDETNQTFDWFFGVADIRPEPLCGRWLILS